MVEEGDFNPESCDFLFRTSLIRASNTLPARASSLTFRVEIYVASVTKPRLFIGLKNITIKHDE